MKIQDSKFKIQNSGFSLVEIIIASAVMLVAWFAVFYTFSVLTQFSSRNTSSIQASMLLEEGSEALRSLRDESWSANIATLNACTISSPCRFTYDQTNNVWGTTITPNLIDGKFDRTFYFSNVYRDALFNVVSSGGTIDPNSEKATIVVSWYQNNATTSQSLETYIFNISNN